MSRQGKYLFNTSSHISRAGLENSASWVVPKNHLIFSMYASIGLVSITKIEIAISQAVLGIKFKKDIDLEFMYYLLIFLKNNLNKFVGEGTQKNLNAFTVRNLEFFIPNFTNQERISKQLNDMDISISILNTKLQKLKLQKQGMMQALLTGKIRLR